MLAHPGSILTTSIFFSSLVKGSRKRNGPSHDKDCMIQRLQEDFKNPSLSLAIYGRTWHKYKIWEFEKM